MLEHLAKPGAAVREVADEVLRFTNEHVKNAPDINNIRNRDYILKNVRLSICRSDWNKEMLSELPHREVPGTDLCIYPKIRISGGSIRTSYTFLESVGITPAEIISAAEKNTGEEYRVTGMSEIISEMSGLYPEEMPPVNMAVISNVEKTDGAGMAVIPEALEEARNMLGSGCIYVIPSSVHEFIAVPAETANPEEIGYMIKDINESIVNEQDRLSDHVYVYDGKSLQMPLCQSHEQRRQEGRTR